MVRTVRIGLVPRLGGAVEIEAVMERSRLYTASGSGTMIVEAEFAATGITDSSTHASVLESILRGAVLAPAREL